MRAPRRDRRPARRHAHRALAGALLIAACPAVTAGGAERAASPRRLRVEIQGAFPHDAGAFTQGLVWHDGALYESTGLYGESTLRRVRLATGEVEALRRLAPEHFGEGLALVGERLVQLTWREGRALVYDLATLEPRAAWSYQGEGWGLCFDGRTLFMSDGSALITRRDPESFAITETLHVALDGRPLSGLNELECAEGWLYANVWQTDWIVRLDPQTGAIEAFVDASALRRAAGASIGDDDVLNGIAYRAETATFLLTGKNWPRIFEVVFVE